MFNDKKTLYSVTVSSFAVLLAAFFVPGEHSGRVAAAVLLLPPAALAYFLIKKRGIPSVNKKEVTLLISLMGVVYVVLYYLSGLKFGFERNYYFLNFGYIIPIAVIIVATEVMRYVIRSQNDKPADLFCYATCVVADALAYGTLYHISSVNRLVDLISVTVLPAVTANLVYHYLSKRYGAYPNIIYRLITTLYLYLIPVLPHMPEALLALVKLFVPIAIYLFIDALYEKKRRLALTKKSKASPVITALAVVILTGFVMLISNRFTYGLLVIATESMTGEINKGDAVVFERYDGQVIEEGQVIVFEQNGAMIVHRVVDIQRVNGENRYFTKGDANESQDAGYIRKSDIRGLADLKIPCVGYPTILLHSLFQG